MSNTIAQSVIEEVLEFVWTEREAGDDSIEKLLAIDEIKTAGATRDTLREMEGLGLLKLDEDSVNLTEEGEEGARGIVRRHRLAERLLNDVLDIERGSLEEYACSFEHSISPVVADSICTLLGHPPSCPHGLPIPRGECCKKTKAELKPLVVSLAELKAKESARIIFIVPATFTRLEKLGSMGLVPGSIVTLEQKKPAFVLKLGETTIALDPDIVKDIYVRRDS